jgi:hypothetical protein
MTDFLAFTLGPLKIVYSRFAAFYPNLLSMLIIMAVGIAVARLARSVAQLLLTASGFDRWSDEMGFTSLLRKADVWARPAQAVSMFLSWALLFIAFLAAMTALNAAMIDAVVASILAYLPRLLSAVLILVVGSVAAGLVSRALLMSLVNSGFGAARHYAQAAKVLMFVLLIAMALEQLRIAPGIVLAAFSIVFGGIVLAIAIACGITGVDVLRKMIDQQAADQGASADVHRS